MYFPRSASPIFWPFPYSTLPAPHGSLRRAAVFLPRALRTVLRRSQRAGVST